MKAYWLSACSLIVTTAAACGPLVNDPVTGDSGAASGSSSGSGTSGSNVADAESSGSGSMSGSTSGGTAPDAASHTGQSEGGSSGASGSASGTTTEAGSGSGSSVDSGQSSGSAADAAESPCPAASTAYAAGAGLPRTGWSATASSTGTDTGDSLANVFDGDLTTRWANGHPQMSGDWFKVNFGHPITISQVVLYLGTTMGVVNTKDFAQMYQVGLSNDDVTYNTVTTMNGSAGGAPATPICFAQQSAQYVKVMLTAPAADGTSWWSIYEVTASP